MKAWSSVISVPGKLFLDHPRSLDETYWQHQHRALRFGISMIVAGVACLIHSLVPVLFVRTASMRVQSLYDEMHVTRRLGGASHRRAESPRPQDVGRMQVGAAAVRSLTNVLNVSPPLCD